MVQVGYRDNGQLGVKEREFWNVASLLLVLSAIQDHDCAVTVFETIELGLFKIFVAIVFLVPIFQNGVVNKEN